MRIPAKLRSFQFSKVCGELSPARKLAAGLNQVEKISLGSDAMIGDIKFGVLWLLAA
jgi:hypothetical protein